MNESKSLCPQEFLQGIKEFNQQRFFECHETLEKLWLKQADPERKFTQGIIQIAVGFHHLAKDNRPGAQKLFERGLSKINTFPATFYGIDVKALMDLVGNQLDGQTETALNPEVQIKLIS